MPALPRAQRALGTLSLRLLLPIATLLLSSGRLGAAPEPTTAGRVAVTIDDVPWVGALPPQGRAWGNDRVVQALVDHQVPATGFVNCDRVEKNDSVLQKWLQAGLELGNHQAAHDDLNKTPEEKWLAGVDRCHELLRTETSPPRAAGPERPPRFFRYPYLYQGPTPEIRARIHAALTHRGYAIAQVSIDNHEWKLGELYGKALAQGQGERAASIARYYVEHVLGATRHFQETAQRKQGHDVGHVLLLHDNRLAAEHLGELLTEFEKSGYKFIPLEEALRDPVYALENAYQGRWGISWLNRVAPVEHPDPWMEASWKEITERFGK